VAQLAVLRVMQQALALALARMVVVQLQQRRRRGGRKTARGRATWDAAWPQRVVVWLQVVRHTMQQPRI
jgi:hypothetical protein